MLRVTSAANISSSLYPIEGIMPDNKRFIDGFAEKTAAELNKGSLKNNFVEMRLQCGIDISKPQMTEPSE